MAYLILLTLVVLGALIVAARLFPRSSTTSTGTALRGRRAPERGDAGGEAGGEPVQEGDLR